MTDDQDAIEHFVAFNVARGIDRKLALEYLLTNNTNDVQSRCEDYNMEKDHVDLTDDRTSRRTVVLLRPRETACLQAISKGDGDLSGPGVSSLIRSLIREGLKRNYSDMAKKFKI